MIQPDYRNIVAAANNQEPARLPLYEHGFDVGIVERVINKPIRPLLEGDLNQRVEGYNRIIQCVLKLGYDCIPFEKNVNRLIQDGQGLMGQSNPIISTIEDLQTYPWEEKLEEYRLKFEIDFEALRRALPDGMKAVGGVGNGPFEVIQDFIPYQELAYLMVDNPEVYSLMWQRIGKLIGQLWKWVLNNYADCFAVCRFGDDLGFRSGMLLNPKDFQIHVLPQYKSIVDIIHSYNKPFLLHSCGKIYDVMESLIEIGIDAKHSNEDAIDLFDVWVEKFGERIGNFGGVEMNIMTLYTPDEVRSYVLDLLERIAVGNGGIAIGTGNQISSYTSPENWVAMCKAVMDFRGD